jgi:hypothetical protein
MTFHRESRMMRRVIVSRTKMSSEFFLPVAGLGKRLTTGIMSGLHSISLGEYLLRLSV